MRDLPYPAEHLVKRAAKCAHGWEPGSPRWSAMCVTFSVGSRSAIAICEFAGVDPHEVRPFPEEVPEEEP